MPIVSSEVPKPVNKWIVAEARSRAKKSGKYISKSSVIREVLEKAARRSALFPPAARL